ncbi:gas vesicle protein [Micromonospora sp. NPDC049836]|uniref:gas vesicle protein n=1 Tax=Micromonospora sp. NPDC049836 TaxID=3364274 RepID=UPI0037B44713
MTARIRGDGDRERWRDRGGRPEERYLDEGDEEAVSAAEAAREGLRRIVELTGRDPLGVTSIQPTDDGWRIGVDVVEHHRIPSSTDLLGLYEVELDMTGSLLGYRRTRRYQRGKED